MCAPIVLMVKRGFCTPYFSVRFGVGAPITLRHKKHKAVVAQLAESFLGTEEVGGSIPPDGSRLLLGIRSIVPG